MELSQVIRRAYAQGWNCYFQSALGGILVILDTEPDNKRKPALSEMAYVEALEDASRDALSETLLRLCRRVDATFG